MDLKNCLLLTLGVLEDYTNNHRQELEIIRLIQKDDRKAFDLLFKRYWKQLLDAAYQRLRSEELAQEAVQELFIDLWSKRSQLHINHSVPAYLHTALKYKVLNQMRSADIQEKHLKRFMSLCKATSNGVEEKVLLNDLEQNYEKEINKLPERCKAVFLLSRKDQLTFKEIAQQLNISINTVEKHMGKALKLLRTNLKDHIASLLVLLISFLK